MTIINSVLEGLTILRFRLERLNERERALVSLATVSCLLLLWYVLSYLPQSGALNRTRTSIHDITQSTMQLTQKRTMIEGLIKDNSVSKLMARYEHVQKDMQELEENIQRYQTRYIDYKQLSSLLYSILQQTTNVSIMAFNDTSTMVIDGAQVGAAPSATAPQPAAPVTPSPTSTEVQASPPLGEQVERYQYKLILKGGYASIAEYLTRLEASGWQFYWDKLTYVVQHYPTALVTIEFYTLRTTTSGRVEVTGAKT